MLYQPIVHLLVMHDDDIGVGQAFYFLLSSQFATAECAQIMDKCNGLSTFQMGNAALHHIKLLERVLNEQYIAFLQFHQKVSHAEHLAEKGCHLPLAHFHRQIDKAHLCHIDINVLLCRIRRVHANVTLHIRGISLFRPIISKQCCLPLLDAQRSSR